MLKQHIQEALQNIRAPKKSCSCGCNSCDDTSPKLALLESKTPISEGLRYHIENGISLQDNVFRMGSKKYLQLFSEARMLNEWKNISLDENSKFLIENTDIGKFGIYEGEKVPLDIPMLDEYSDENFDSLEDSIAQAEFGMDYDQLGPGEKEFVRDEIDNMSMNEGTSSVNENKNPYKKGDKVKYQLTFRGGVGKYADAISKSKEIKTGVIKKRIKTLSSFKYELTNGLEINQSEIMGLAEQVSEAREYKKGDKLKVKLKNGKEFEVTFDSYSSNKGIAFGRIDGDKKPFSLDAVVNEAKKKKKDPPIGKPKRSSSGGKAYKVFVRDPKTKKVKTVRFGSGGLRAKIRNPKARNAFAKRHDCKNKKDRTKASYWSCNLPRYAPALGLGPKMNTFW
jgi:hypothetical protein